MRERAGDAENVICNQSRIAVSADNQMLVALRPSGCSLRSDDRCQQAEGTVPPATHQPGCLGHWQAGTLRQGEAQPA